MKLDSQTLAFVLAIAAVLWAIYKGGRSINGAGYGPGSFVLDIAMACICLACVFGVVAALKAVGL